MIDRITRRRVAGVASMTALLLAIAVPASAHVFIVDGSAVVGGGYGTEITIRVPHGCDGAATTALEVQIPAGVTERQAQAAGRLDHRCRLDATGPAVDGTRMPRSPTSRWTP